MLLATAMRLIFGWSIVRETRQRDWRWWGFVGSTYAGALMCAVFCCAAAGLHRADAILLPAFTLVLLAVNGEAVALSFDVIVAQSYIAILTAPAVLWGVIQGQTSGYCFAILTGLFGVQLSLQIKYRSAWYSGALAAQAKLITRIAELQRSVSELEKANAEAERVSGTRQGLLTVMSREVRTSLNAVIPTAELLLATDFTAEQREFTSAICASGGALVNVVNEFLDLADIEAGRLVLEGTDFDLRILAGQATALATEQAQQDGLRFRCVIGDHVPSSLTGDAARLRQLLHSLLSDVGEFSHQGEVVLRVDTSEAYGAAVTLRFTIIVTNGGIARELQKRLFESPVPSESLIQRHGQGAGLGLAICKRLAELMGGQVGVESAEDGGSGVWFTLPLRISGRRDDGAPDLRKARILVVDDNATNRTILSSQLAVMGMSVACADSGAAALEALACALAEGKPYHAALVDDSMPQMDGWRLARLVRMKSSLDDLVVILLSSKALPPGGEELREYGFAGCILKPVRPEQVQRCLMATLQNTGTLTADPEDSLESSAFPGRLLLAEDDAVNQKIACRVLEKLGYYVDSVNNGAEAVEKYGSGIYDAVLMDLQMPKMDGYSATREIRLREQPGRHCTIIALSASGMTGDREKCLAAGMDDYVAKPVRSDELQRTLQRHLRRIAPQRSRPVSAISAVRPAGELAERLRELEHSVGSAALAELVNGFLSETAGYVDRLREAMQRADDQAALDIIEALGDCSANMGATHLSELCLQLAKRKSLEDHDPMLHELAEAQRSLTRDIGEMYPAWRAAPEVDHADMTGSSHRRPGHRS